MARVLALALLSALLEAAPSKPDVGASQTGEVPARLGGPSPKSQSGRPGPRRFNPTPGGWARYLADSPAGPQVFVRRVGEVANVGGERGRWLRSEFEVPEVGRIGIDVLVVGTTLNYQALRKVRVVGPFKQNEQTQAAVDRRLQVPEAPRATLTRKSTQQIAGRTIAVEEYDLDDGSYEAWSPDVPGTGIVRLSGVKQQMLVAFGVGGDPWDGAARDLAEAHPGTKH